MVSVTGYVPQSMVMIYVVKDWNVNVISNTVQYFSLLRFIKRMFNCFFIILLVNFNISEVYNFFLFGIVKGGFGTNTFFVVHVVHPCLRCSLKILLIDCIRAVRMAANKYLRVGRQSFYAFRGFH